MDASTMQIMKEWKSKQAKEILSLGYNTMGKNQLVFTNLKNKPGLFNKLINNVIFRF